MIYRYLYGTRRAVLARAGLLIAVIALILHLVRGRSAA